MNNTRVKNIQRNLIFNVIKYGVDIIFKFILRTVLIYYMGAQYIGLNGLFSNIFTFLNLADLGIGSAIVFSMYKPIAENDIEKIKTLQNLYKKFYLIIGIVILVLGGLLTPFIHVFMNGGAPPDINVYLLFIMYIVNAVCGYLFAHKRSLLFAYQRNDIENKIRSICTILMSGIQIVVIILFKNYYVFFAINILFTVIESVWIYLIAIKRYPLISGPSGKLDEGTKKEITKNVVALSMHKIGGAVVGSTDNILISSFVGLTVLGAYSNYAMIANTLYSLFLLLTNALTGSLGNMVASCDKEYCYRRFKQLNFMFSYLSAFMAICFFVLVQPFMKTWTSNNADYLLNNWTVLLFCLSFYLLRIRSNVLLFKDCTGLFWQDRWKPIVEAVVNLVASIVLAKFMGLNGIILGTIISTIVAPLWVEPLVLFKHYFNKPVMSYLLRLILDLIITVVVGTACYYICLFIPEGGIALLLLRFIICIMLCSLLLLIFYLLTPECRQILKSVLKKLKKEKQN